MMDGSSRTKVLIAGGGVAALEAALALKDLAEDRVDVELLAAESHFTYRPLAVAEPFRLGTVERFELGTLLGAIGATHTLGALVAVDADRHVARTSTNTELSYDQLLVAIGAVPTIAIPGALTFRGPIDGPDFERLLESLIRGEGRSVAFVIPWGAVWPLPAYELALMTAAHLRAHELHEVELTVVTPELEPLYVFGEPAIAAVRELLVRHGVTVLTEVHAARFHDGGLELLPGGRLEVDRAVALPRLIGSQIAGLPQSTQGFIRVDGHCRVVGVDDVYAAGDITSFPVKQGGIAAQQADAAADAIAAVAGAEITPEVFRPVLRGVLLTGREPRYLRHELDDSEVGAPEALAALEPLWWPPAKIVGRYLAPFLASIAGAETPAELAASVPSALPLEVELIPETLGEHELLLAEEGDGPSVELVTREPVVAAPEDTLGEIAESLVRDGAGAAVVCEYGRVVGIVTSADLVRAVAARAHPSDARARLWMTAEPVTISARSSVGAASLLMREYGLGHLVVMDGDRLVGMLEREALPADVPNALTA